MTAFKSSAGLPVPALPIVMDPPGGISPFFDFDSVNLLMRDLE